MGKIKDIDNLRNQLVLGEVKLLKLYLHGQEYMV